MREEGVVGRGGENGGGGIHAYTHTHTYIHTHLFILLNLVSVMSPTVSRHSLHMFKCWSSSASSPLHWQPSFLCVVSLQLLNTCVAEVGGGFYKLVIIPPSCGWPICSPPLCPIITLVTSDLFWWKSCGSASIVVASVHIASENTPCQQFSIDHFYSILWHTVYADYSVKNTFCYTWGSMYFHTQSCAVLCVWWFVGVFMVGME